ncbi:type VII toxin-antitoxin system MntA family adenylyltransferase antitoxin [Hydrogenimonas sp.]
MVTNLAKEVLQPYNFIDFALLFGSCASGKDHPMSDIDIAIHTNRPIDLLEQGALIGALEERLGKDVDLVILNNLYKKNAKLAFNIVDNHTIIFNRSQKAYADFKFHTYKYYFDQKPMYEMFDKALKERLADGTYGKTQTP